MSEGDLSSWIVAGVVRVASATALHALRPRPLVQHAGVSGRQSRRARGGHATAAATSASCTASIAGRSTPALTVDYGARYAHYDYLAAARAAQPARRRRRSSRSKRHARHRDDRAAHGRAGRRGVPAADDRRPVAAARAHVRAARRATRTCASSAPASSTSVVEHEFGDAYVVGVGRFHQSVDDQLVTLFGLSMPGGPQSVGHYYVAERRRRRRRRLGVRAEQPPANARARLGRLQP